jgi:cytochrome b561
MRLHSPRHILRRSVLARDAVYHAPSVGTVRRSNATRVLHLLLLVTVIHQLASSQFISRPIPGEAPSLLYSLHEYIGMASLAVVLAFWIWTLVRQGETKFTKLFPWFSPRAALGVVQDALSQLRAILRRDLMYEGNGDMASAVHGLGLLAVTAMAATGTVYFLFRGNPLAHQALALHSAIANLMWVYLFGHAGIAALHHLLGSDILRRMFWIGRGVTVSCEPDYSRARQTHEIDA